MTAAVVGMAMLGAGALAVSATAPGFAKAPPKAAKTAPKTIIVEMKDMGPEGAMVFVPGFVKANPGDTVRFVPTSPAHNAETIATMLPAGVAPTKGGMNKAFDLVVTTPGVYGIKCLPHYSMGMVALVQVGNGPSANLAAAKAVKLPPFANKRMSAYLAKAQ
ncbi:pseudoazurin [Sphingomonas immobilis]|uniref:Pseudoazurin n=1 Tax=Sphingomonas immobilis TaxID=3063997 RepID=A0ABT9A256_9SPHN|nr:pseudoazurin [Sphingomonas sp. CA1-15]MDO7843915.1 pseudoazurin [Sphingomonas sp. CA1-15]